MLKIDMPKPTNCGECFLCKAGRCEKAYEAYLKMGSAFFKAVFEPDFMLDDCPIEEIDEAQLPKEGKWIMCESEKPYIVGKCSVCGGMSRERGDYCPSCGARMKG